ncbi:MAG: carbohydrate ABC transporter permease [Candidatus Caldatribacterium sp.]|nr:carbohydrate ABC transporter permease [Candidatus Caldatribacterium sp.]
MKRGFLSATLYYTLIAFLLGVILVPIYWLIMPSFLPASEMFAFPPHLFPKSITLEHYYDLFATYPKTVTIDMLLYLRNSCIACGAASGIVLVISILAGYALARGTFRGKTTLRTTILLTQMMPAVLFFIPIYLLMKQLNLINNLLALILIYPGMVAPFSTFISEAYIANIPQEIEESALLDGASTNTILFRIILPLSAPMVVAILIYSFVWMWNDLVISLVLCHANEVRTASVGLFSFIGAATVEWGGLLAGTVLCILPPLFLFAFFQRFIIQGILAGSLKA